MLNWNANSFKAYETPNLLSQNGVSITSDTSVGQPGLEAQNLIQNLSIRSPGNNIKPYYDRAA